MFFSSSSATKSSVSSVVFSIGAILVLSFSYAHAELTEEQRRVPLEAVGAGAKIVLLAGSPSNKAGQHEYFAGCALMMDWLHQTPGVAPVLAADGWPKNDAILDGARAVVVFADGGAKLPFLAESRWAKMRALIEGGAGFVMLHQAVDVPAAQADEMRRWLGAVWQPDIGSRGHWDMSFADFPKHPTLRGVTAFDAPLDGWLYNLHFAAGAVPLLAGAVPDKSRTTADAKTHTGRAEVVAWAYERPGGGRSFAFTGCDLHSGWRVESQRRFVTNGILWSARLDIPEAGAPVAMQTADLAKNFDAKPAPKAAATPAAKAP
jgi:hypothetical protein